MVLWFAGLSVVLVWLIFHDPAIDYRVVVAGALVPDIVDAPAGGARVMHSVLGCALLLAVVMAVTRRRRVLRRRLLGLPIGALLHLALDGVWAKPRVFWWPFLGWHAAASPLPSLHHPVAVIVAEELAGMLALGWVWVRFGLASPERRRHLWRTGRFPREAVG